MSYLKISGGCVYDPANGVDGELRDVWVREGKITAPPDRDATIKTVDVTGMVVMPGAVDMHCHIAGPKVNAARKLQPEMTRQAIECGSMAAVPDIVTTGLRYTGLGYTTCFDAAISPLAARHVHHEFSQVPNVDTGFFVLVGNNHYVMECVSRHDDDGLQAFLAWLLKRSGGFAPKLVNPGGVELWKQKHDGNARDLDQTVTGFNVTPRQIIGGRFAGSQLAPPAASGSHSLQQPGPALETGKRRSRR